MHKTVDEKLLYTQAALCDNLEGWDGGRREAQETWGICIIMADLHRCTAETNTML